jgi:hypothetical protein
MIFSNSIFSGDRNIRACGHTAQCPCSHYSQTRSCPANELDWRETLPRPCPALPPSNNGQRTTPLTKSACREPSIRAPVHQNCGLVSSSSQEEGHLCYQGSCSVWGTAAAHLRRVETCRPCSLFLRAKLKVKRDSNSLHQGSIDYSLRRLSLALPPASNPIQ